MKKFTFLVALLFILSSLNLRAQNNERRWALGINWQWEDFHTLKRDLPKQLKYTRWQGYPFPSAISVGRYINPSFNVFGQFGLSKLEDWSMAEPMVNTPISDENFWTGDVNLAYKFANGYIMRQDSWFDPYIYLGVGATKIYDLGADKTTYFKQVTGVGFNFWLTPVIGLNFQAAKDFIIAPKLSTTDERRPGYMHFTTGLKFRLGMKDKDNDGISDSKDRCPETPGKPELQGCPDRDNDGVADIDDDCPDVAGKIEFKGCPDTDGDEIIDKDDRCPTVFGLKALQGCPDKDGDGIADMDDRCPDVAGLKEFKGCPDTDGDGIVDIDDRCPDVKGLQSLNGCPDRDNDGIADIDDKCPDVSGPASNNGCPEVKKIELDKVVYFATDKSVVLPEYTDDLDELVSIMKENMDINIIVEGNADSRGTDEYNMKLSERRADYVINYLANKGIAKDRMVKKYYGESKPAASNNTIIGLGLNRRDEIRIK